MKKSSIVERMSGTNEEPRAIDESPRIEVLIGLVKQRVAKKGTIAEPGHYFFGRQSRHT